MALEEGFVDGYVLQGKDLFSGNELFHPVDQKKRIPVGQELHNFLNIINTHI